MLTATKTIFGVALIFLAGTMAAKFHEPLFQIKTIGFLLMLVILCSMRITLIKSK